MANQYNIDSFLLLHFIDNNSGLNFNTKNSLVEWHSSLLDIDDNKNRCAARELITHLAEFGFGRFLYPSSTQKKLISVFEPLENITRLAISIDEKNKGKIRDHLNHTIRNILFSNYILHKFYKTAEYDVKILMLSAIFHDIGYPIEKFKDLTSEITYTAFKEYLNSDAKLEFEISNPEILLDILHVIGSLKLTKIEQYDYSQEELNSFNKKVDFIYKEIASRAIAGKGLFEAPHFLSSFIFFIRPYVIQWKDDPIFWNENIKPIIEICFAIAFHDRKMDLTLLDKLFNEIPEISLSLRIADELQEWDRDHVELQFVSEVDFVQYTEKKLELLFYMKDRLKGIGQDKCSPNITVYNKVVGLLPVRIRFRKKA